MTQKHFKIIAGVLLVTRPLNSESKAVKLQWNRMVRDFADTCEAHNSGFKRDLFYQACGGLFY